MRSKAGNRSFRNRNIFIVLLALAAASCSSSVSEEGALAFADATAEPAFNEASVFDAYVMDNASRFNSGVDRSELAAQQVILARHCVGDLTDEVELLELSWAGLDIDDVSAITVDECNQFLVTPVSIRTPSPDTDSWAETISERFDRTYWWYGPNVFEAKAIEACDNGWGLEDLVQDELLGQSASVEIISLIENGECARLTDADRAAAPTAVPTLEPDESYCRAMIGDDHDPTHTDPDYYQNGTHEELVNVIEADIARLQALGVPPSISFDHESYVERSQWALEIIRAEGYDVAELVNLPAAERELLDPPGHREPSIWRMDLYVSRCWDAFGNEFFE